METEKPDQPPEPEPDTPVEEDAVEDAVDLKDRAVSIVSREANDFIGQLTARFKDKLNDFLDRLEGKNQ